MKAFSFKIQGMDCAEEVGILRREIGPLVGGEENLSFDLINGRMTVSVGDAAVDEEMIRKAVNRTGMKAMPREERYPPGTKSPVAEGLWQAQGRLIMCAASGLSLLTAFLTQVHYKGSIGHAFTSHAFPAYTIILYLTAIICGGWFIITQGGLRGTQA